MKITILFVFLGTFFTGFAQLKSGDGKTLNSVSSENRTAIKVENPSGKYPILVDAEPTDEQKLESIKSTTAAIHEKMAFVKSDEKLDAKAKENHWYERAEEILKELNDEKTALEQKLNK